MHYLLLYEFTADYLQRRASLRKEHLRLAWESQARGELILGGALANPPDKAVLLFRGDDDRAARLFAEHDPYVRAGLVTRWSVREWSTVVGEHAANALREPP